LAYLWSVALNLIAGNYSIGFWLFFIKILICLIGQWARIFAWGTNQCHSPPFPQLLDNFEITVSQNEERKNNGEQIAGPKTNWLRGGCILGQPNGNKAIGKLDKIVGLIFWVIKWSTNRLVFNEQSTNLLCFRIK